MPNHCYFVDFDKYIRMEMRSDDQVGDRFYYVSKTNAVKAGVYEIIDIDNKTHPDNPIYILLYRRPRVEYYFIFVDEHGKIAQTKLKVLMRPLNVGDLINDNDNTRVLEVLHKSGLKIFVRQYRSVK